MYSPIDDATELPGMCALASEAKPPSLLADFSRDLGTVGGGNHFAELQVIEEVVDAKLLAGLGINAHQLLLLVRARMACYFKIPIHRFLAMLQI